MQKLSNSNLFNSLVATAETVKPVEKPSFAESVLQVLKTAHKEPTLLDIIRKAQLGLGEEPPPTESVGMPAEEPTPAETDVTDMGPDAGGDEEPKKMVAKALLALCGGDVEAACECLRTGCGEEGMPEEMPPDEALPEEVPPVGGPAETEPLPTDKPML